MPPVSAADVALFRDLDDQDRKTKLFSLLEGEDDLGVVLRAHIVIEHELKDFVMASAPKPEHVKFSDYDYDGVVTLACILGLSPELKPALSSIGNLRNKFAHELDMKLADQQTNNLYKLLSGSIKSNVQEAYADLLKTPKYQGYPKINDLDPKTLFGICVIFIREEIAMRTAQVHAIRHEVEELRTQSEAKLGT